MAHAPPDFIISKLVWRFLGFFWRIITIFAWDEKLRFGNPGRDVEKRHHKEEKMTVIQPGLDLDAMVKSSKFLN